MASSSTQDTQKFCRDYSIILCTSTSSIQCRPYKRARRDQRQRIIRECHNYGRQMNSYGRYIHCKDYRKAFQASTQLQTQQQQPTLTCIDCHQDIPSRHKRKRLAQCHDCRQRRAFNQQTRYPKAYTSSFSTRVPLDLGRMDIECKECKALHWKAEGTDVSGADVKGDISFESCYKKGSVKLDALPEPPEPLRNLLCLNESPARRFQSQIRQYNTALSYTSCSYTPDPRLHAQEHTYIFQLQGAIYHHQGPLSTTLGIRPSYAQLYFLDPIEATRIRLNNNYGSSSSVDPHVLKHLDFILRGPNNPFHKLYYRASEILHQQAALTPLRLTPQLRLTCNDGSDLRRYNLPTINHELVALIPDIPSEYGRRGYRDILLYLQHVSLAS